MSIKEYGRILRKIHFTIVLEPEHIGEFKERIVETVENAGLKAYVRADGYAIMQNEMVGALGLPHVRLGIVEDKVMVWIRDPHKLDGELIEKAGLGVEEYVMQILNVTRALLDAFNLYREKAKAIYIEYPIFNY
ncbi:MAG: hypothetical protein DRZ80_07370 [Thermoprotei archaeon]|nr:MAG: hypothetical protein DRZ80_07370 [Thermoprotei archaeon]